tara:strand:- start:6266 stop:7387 length:1122 start_codon:yes stop_codon:yes gene_type:complete
MNNNTLIAGFEDIMTHIKNQEIRIKKLEEEKKELHNSRSDSDADYEKLVDKNNNDNLNFADILSERDDEIKKLKDDLMRDELDVDDVKDANLSLKELIDELREENKKLKNTLDVWENPTGRTFVEEIQKLKKENEKLRQWQLSDEMIDDISAENIDEFERDVRDNWDELNKEAWPTPTRVLEKKLKAAETKVEELKEENEKFGNHIAEQEQELQELRVENTKIHTLEACNGMQKEKISELKEEIDELEEETTPLTTGPVSILQEKNYKLEKELVTLHEYLRQFSAAGKEAVRMTKDIIMNLMIKIIKELCDEDSVDIEKEWQADTRGVKWTDKDYNDFMINICKDMDDDNWNDFGGITLEWKDDTLYFRRVEP